MLAPLSASTAVIAYRMYSLQYDADGFPIGTTQTTNLTLTPDLLAQEIQGAIQNSAMNPQVKALNSGMIVRGRTSLNGRAEHSSENYVLSSWLADAAPARWTTPPS